MDSEIIDAVTGWDSAPAGRGYAGLRELADSGFTGAVVTNLTWSFMLNGRLLGVFDGTIEDFDDASFEAHRAPDPSLPLLYAMMETGGETRAQYYTEDTPLSDADSTLKAGGFTGYIELSENVLSGDYYVVYHGGKSLSAAYVGNSRRLITDDEAFERANDEIGIYNVIDVDLDIVEIPDAEAEPESAPAATPAADDGSSDEPEAEGEVETTTESEPETPESAPETTDEPVEVAEAEPSAAETSSAADTSSAVSEESADVVTEAEPTTAEPTTAAPDSESAPETVTAASPAGASSDSVAESEQSEGDGSDVFSAEAEWRNARSIPSLDPKSTAGESVKKRKKRTSKSATGRKRSAKSRTQSQDAKQTQPQRTRTRQRTQSKQSSQASNGAQSGALREKLTAVTAERDKLESQKESLQQKLEQTQAENEQLEARVADLEAEIERLESTLADIDVHTADETMGADEALRGTNLFVRYKRKGEATLEKAHRGQVKRDELLENLRLEHHTTFDTESLSVDGQPYEEFLHATAEFGFAKWVVTDLLYEIGETGNRSELAGVFNSIPEVDRVELYGSVSIPLGDEGDSETRRFDVIFRDQMGEPLFVANMNDSRDPATESMVRQLIKDSKAVAESGDTLGSAFVVTKSFFEPEALEATAAETGGGLLSRSKRKSFVKLSRKQGYHLCLVEARSGEFHLNVPDI
ncbi:hypothetical protein ACFQJC_10180 [Haloferax namakaokahaiae]|uniref:DUF7527 domain-containing protein n=1 Tax=Haloferax namakaokahaiae TaxID=1748331 RepID=A0ABD5ZF71_9EURY